MALLSMHLISLLSFVFIILSVCIFSCNCSKYSETANPKNVDPYQDSGLDLDFENQERPFRMNKVNLMWTKAKKRLSGRKLADLYADLKVHDHKEAHLKKIKSENSDKDGLKEAEVLTSYNKIMWYYDLAAHLMHEKNEISNEIPDDEDEKKSVHFQDIKLRGMWRRAGQAGFSTEDLNILKEEFWHQQMRINEFEFMGQEIGTTDPEDNFVNTDDVKIKTNLSPQDVKGKHITMKQKNKEIREGYLKLEHLQSTFQGSEPLFKDTRVHYLWALAQKTNWSQAELEAFKEELQHFEQRLSKKTYYDEQLSYHDDSNGEKSEKMVLLEEKTSDINQKVKKLHGDFKHRLEKALRHTEL